MKLFVTLLFVILFATFVFADGELTLHLFTQIYSLRFLFVDRKCVDGKSYYDGCNTCICGNGNVACTLVACIGPDGKSTPSKEPPADFWQE